MRVNPAQDPLGYMVPLQFECYYTFQSKGLGIRSPGLRPLRNSLDLIHNMKVRSEGLYVKYSSTFSSLDTQGFPKIVIFFKKSSLRLSKCLYYPSKIQIHCPHPFPRLPLQISFQFKQSMHPLPFKILKWLLIDH